MKYLYSISLILFFFFSSIISYGQSHEAYIINNKGLIKDSDRYIKALDSADLDRYRLENDRVVLNFKCGIEVMLYSHNELINGHSKGNKINIINHNAVFALHSSGIILETHQVKTK